VISATYRIAGGDFDGAGAATRTLKGELARIGVEAAVMRRIMIAAYEAEMNVVIHSRGGSMWARIDDHRLDLEIVDEGPGIPDVELALKEGFSTADDRARQMGFGAGMGLPNIRKSSDLFEIESRSGKGTRIRSTIYLDGMAAEPTRRAFLGINAASCRSCMDCVKACPTKALRVRGGGPRLLGHLCIDCTACITVCPSSVFGAGDGRAAAGPLAAAEGAVLVVPRGFVHGFPGNVGAGKVMEALRRLGFRHIRFTEDWEAALRREAVSRARVPDAQLPLIPPVCPAVVNLIESHFPSLIPNLVPLSSPLEAAAREFNTRPVYLTAACPAQFGEAVLSSPTDRMTVLTPRRLAEAIAPFLSGEKRAPVPAAVAGDPSGKDGPAAFVRRVTGIKHVTAVLEQYEGGALPGSGVLELFACDQGCAGSPLFALDPYVAAIRGDGGAVDAETAGRCAIGAPAAGEASASARKRPFAARPGLRLDADMGAAIAKLSRIDVLHRLLPGRDCGTCGAPTCAAFAEDVVLGRAAETECPYKEKHE
jgi:anti-sigma regulatory factor (Ser/Thr protein kinase)